MIPASMTIGFAEADCSLDGDSAKDLADASASGPQPDCNATKKLVATDNAARVIGM